MIARRQRAELFVNARAPAAAPRPGFENLTCRLPDVDDFVKLAQGTVLRLSYTEKT